MISKITPVVLFIAFLLLLLVSLSVPIIHSIYLFKMNAHFASSLLKSSASTSAIFGLWGYCILPSSVSIVGISESSNEYCSQPALRYQIDDRLASALGISRATNAVSRTLTAALVLNPIACALTFLAFVFSLFMIRRAAESGTPSRLASFVTTILGSLAALITTIVFIINISFVAVTKSHIKNDTDGDVTVDYGAAVWMSLVAMLLLWAGTLGACCGVIAIRRHRSASKY